MCDELMCKTGLYTKKEASKWLLEHHPDKGNKATSVNIGDVASCMKNKSFCTRKNKNKSNSKTSTIKNQTQNKSKKNSNSPTSINRIYRRVHQSSLSRDKVPEEPVHAAYKPDEKQLACVRQVSNWSKITASNRFNKSRFDIQATDKLIPIASPKLEALLQNITALDTNDKMLYGKTFKHFIFSDIKFLGYGAKIISAGFIARGFRPVLKFEKSRIVVDVPKGDGNNFAVLSSTALWDSPFKHKLKKEVLDMFNKRPDNIYGENCRFIILDSGFKEGLDLFDVRYVHLFEPLITEADMTQAVGRATRLCGQKGLDFIPNKGWPLNIYKYSQNIPEELQDSFKAKNLTEITLQLKGLDARLHNISKAIKDVSILAAVDQPLTEEIHKSGLMPRLVVKTKNTTSPLNMELSTNIVDMTSSFTRKNLSPKLMIEDNLMLENNLMDSLDVESKIKDPCDDCFSRALIPFSPTRLSSKVVTPKVVIDSNMLVVYENNNTEKGAWYNLRKNIMNRYGKMAWPKQEIVNNCIDKKGVAPPPINTKKDYIVSPKRKILPQLNLVDYTPTQNFISSYFTIKSPIKGMLLWHSVGTGKTCSAIALASSQFEPAGYSIIWVTRHTLKADIWKNIFDQVCHNTIANEVRNGKLAPEDVEKRQKLLAQQWIPPMSYRQFSNLVQGKNTLYDLLKKRNGKMDPLKKTLIIIDEAHKLYSSDFKGAEKPDVPAFMAALQNSYKVSGNNSARVLLMTATPYNESPMELMSLLNLCRLKEDALPTVLTDFVAKYMDNKGNFTKEGLENYMNSIAGQISYLNREADPSQFAQPIYADIVVPMSTINSVGDSDELLDIKKEITELLNEKQKIENEIIPHLQNQLSLFGPSEDAKIKECNEMFEGKPKDLKDCIKRVVLKYKSGKKLEEKNLRNAIKRVEKIEKELVKLNTKSLRLTKKLKKTGLSSLTQQAQFETRCKISS
jgi:superfamily II DNA or RNA helicase